MIAMSVGDDGSFHGTPGIDIKITGTAIETFVGKFN
jgi:hypothetical protein